MGIRELSLDLEKIATKELGEVTSRRQNDVQSIKDWLGKQKHLKANMDDQWLITFLRGCKYSLVRTKQKIDNFYSMRTALPEIIEGKDPTSPIQQELLSKGLYVPLFKTAEPGAPRVVLLRPGVYDPNRITFNDTLATMQMFADTLLMEDDTTSVAGHILVIDLADVTMGHFSQMTPTNVKKFVALGQDVLPIRQKGSHFINTPPGFETVLNLVKIFLNEKNKSRLFAHNQNMNELYKYIPTEILPSEYGGEAGSIKEMIDYWKKKMESLRDWIVEDQKNKSDESKRPGKPKTAQDSFGTDGSFRKLNVD